MKNPAIELLSQNEKYNKLIQHMFLDERKTIVPVGDLKLLTIGEISVTINETESLFSDVRETNSDNSMSKMINEIVNHSTQLKSNIKNKSCNNLSSYDRATMLMAYNSLMFRDTKLVKLLFSAIDSILLKEYGKKSFHLIEFKTHTIEKETSNGKSFYNYLVIKTLLFPMIILPVNSLIYV